MRKRSCPVLVETYQGRSPSGVYAPPTAHPTDVTIALREKGWVPYRIAARDQRISGQRTALIGPQRLASYQPRDGTSCPITASAVRALRGARGSLLLTTGT